MPTRGAVEAPAVPGTAATAADDATTTATNGTARRPAARASRAPAVTGRVTAMSVVRIRPVLPGRPIGRQVPNATTSPWRPVG